MYRLNFAKISLYFLPTLFFNLMQPKSPSYLFDKFIFRQDVHSHTIRKSHLLTMSIHSGALFDRSFTYCAVITYNTYSLLYVFELSQFQAKYNKRVACVATHLISVLASYLSVFLLFLLLSLSFLISTITLSCRFPLIFSLESRVRSRVAL